MNALIPVMLPTGKANGSWNLVVAQIPTGGHDHHTGLGACLPMLSCCSTDLKEKKCRISGLILFCVLLIHRRMLVLVRIVCYEDYRILPSSACKINFDRQQFSIELTLLISSGSSSNNLDYLP